LPEQDEDTTLILQFFLLNYEVVLEPTSRHFLFLLLLISMAWPISVNPGQMGSYKGYWGWPLLSQDFWQGNKGTVYAKHIMGAIACWPWPSSKFLIMAISTPKSPF